MTIYTCSCNCDCKYGATDFELTLCMAFAAADDTWGYHIEAWTKWPTLCRRHLQLHFHKWKCLNSQIVKFMGPTWGPPGPCRPQMGPMLAPWTLLVGFSSKISLHFVSMVQFTISHRTFGWWLGAEPVTSHNLNQWWPCARRIYASSGFNVLNQWCVSPHFQIGIGYV